MTCSFSRSVGLFQAVLLVGVVPAEHAEPPHAAEVGLPHGALSLFDWHLKGIDDLSSSYFNVASVK